MYGVELKYSGQIISVKMTSEQRVEYEKLSSDKWRIEFLFNNYTPLTKRICSLLEQYGEWNVGNWFECAVTIGTIAEITTASLVTRNIFEVVYHPLLVDENWCSLKTLSLDHMVQKSQLPRYICNVLYELHEESNDSGLLINSDLETGLQTVKR